MKGPTPLGVTDMESARIHLPLLGESTTFEVEFASAPGPLTQVLPIARSLAQQTLEKVTEGTGRQPSCSVGCAACCRHLVMLTPPEALALRDAFVELPPEQQARVRARFDEARQRAETAGLVRDGGFPLLRGTANQRAHRLRELGRSYFALGIPCPFLEHESCSIYPIRPLACREFLVFSDKRHCQSFASAAREMVPVLQLTRATGRAAQSLAQLENDGIPMLFMFEGKESEWAKARRPVEGLALLRALLSQLGEVEERP